MLLNNQQITEEKKIKICIEMNENNQIIIKMKIIMKTQ